MTKQLIISLFLIMFCFCNPIKGYSLVAEDGIKGTASINGFEYPDTTTYFIINEADATAEICLDIPLHNSLLMNITDNGQPYTDLYPCLIDTIVVFSYSPLFNEGDASTGPYILDSWTINEIVFSGEFPHIQALVDSMNLWDQVGVWELDETTKSIITDLNSNDYGAMDIYVPYTNLTSQLTRALGNNINGTSYQFGEGIHEIIVEDTMLACTDTFSVVVYYLPTESVAIEVFPGETGEYCLDYTQLHGNIESVDWCSGFDATIANFEFNADSTCVQYTGLSVGLTSVCIVACDDNGFCDTTLLNLNVDDTPHYNVVEEELIMGTTGVYCIENHNLGGILGLIQNNCAESSEDNVNFILNSSTNCVTFSALSVGIDTACLILCNDANICDTTVLIVTVGVQSFDTEIISITTYPKMRGEICVDTTELPGNIVDFYNGCEDLQSDDIIYEWEFGTYCVNYTTAREPGMETACIYLEDDNGLIDTTLVDITVILPPAEYIEMSVSLDGINSYCLDTTQLGGTVVGTYNLCQNNNANVVNFEINDVYCVRFEGLSPGVDTACYIVCDNWSICDTTYLYITVVDTDLSSPPIAVQDAATLLVGEVGRIDVIQNDSLVGDSSNITIISQESIQYGNAMALSDGTIMYVLNSDVCSVIDTIYYEICTANGCDTGLLEVSIDCEPTTMDAVTVFTGITPNNDGKNDYFLVQGLETIPNHKLSIYNRWGNLLYETTDYQNDWNGNWEGDSLPDGTYFYMLEDDTGNTRNGFIYLYR